jgi:hypothetical protein
MADEYESPSALFAPNPKHSSIRIAPVKFATHLEIAADPAWFLLEWFSLHAEIAPDYAQPERVLPKLSKSGSRVEQRCAMDVSGTAQRPDFSNHPKRLMILEGLSWNCGGWKGFSHLQV